MGRLSLTHYAEGAPSIRKWSSVAGEVSQYWTECPDKEELLRICHYEELALIVWYLFRHSALHWAAAPIEALEGQTLQRLLANSIGYAALRGYLAEDSRLKHIILKA